MNSNIIRNRLISVGHTLLLGLSFFFGQAQATGATYDGIYQWSPGNFLSLHQDGTNMIATIYFNTDGNVTVPATVGVGTLLVPQLDLFDLMHGEVTGSTATIDGTRFHRACNVGYDFKFNIDSSITVTRIGVSNTPAANSAGISCSAILSAEATPLTVPKIRFGPNSAPVANAGSAQNVVVGTVVTLDGSASTDADGNALTYAWTLTTKPAGSAASLSSATSVKPTFTADVAGTYGASLIVSDGQTSSIVSTVTVVASGVPLSGMWSIYTADKQTFLATYFLYSEITTGVNGWYIKGSNSAPYFGFPSWMDGTAVQAGFNTSISKYYIIDFSAEKNFIWEFQFDSATKPISGCRYRYVAGQSDKGACLLFWGN